MPRSWLRTVVMAAALPALVAAQASDVPIVASVKPSTDNQPGMVIRPMPPGSYAAIKAPILSLLTAAFGVSPDRIAGVPLPPQRYDVEARAAATEPGAAPPSTAVVLQSLLRQRFGLVVHHESRETPVYVLKVARSDGRLGPDLHPATCVGAACHAVEEPDHWEATGTTLATLARALRIPSGRTVIDQTGLTGTWDVSISFAPLRDQAGDQPTIFTVIQERLGLKLEAATAPLDLVVVDAVREPTGN